MSPPPVLILDAAEQARAPFKAALADLWRGLRHVELWGEMGWLDVRQRYSRSVLGPFWVTLSLAVFVLGLGVTYGALFKIPLDDYLPYLTIGVVVWTLLSTILLEGCAAFTAAEALVKQMQASLSVFVFRVVWRCLIIFGHNLVIVVATLAWFRVAFLPGFGPALLGLALVVVNGFGFALTLGTLSARFRDIPPLMANIVQTLFFLTPVLWQVAALGDRQLLATLNPLYHLIEIVRAPLLGDAVAPNAWTFSLLFTAANLAVAFLLYARFRWRIPYWL